MHTALYHTRDPPWQVKEGGPAEASESRDNQELLILHISRQMAVYVYISDCTELAHEAQIELGSYLGLLRADLRARTPCEIVDYLGRQKA